LEKNCEKLTETYHPDFMVVAGCHNLASCGHSAAFQTEKALCLLFHSQAT
jgi:hypothetical protein